MKSKLCKRVRNHYHVSSPLLFFWNRILLNTLLQNTWLMITDTRFRPRHPERKNRIYACTSIQLMTFPQDSSPPTPMPPSLRTSHAIYTQWIKSERDKSIKVCRIHLTSTTLYVQHYHHHKVHSNILQPSLHSVPEHFRYSPRPRAAFCGTVLLIPMYCPSCLVVIEESLQLQEVKVVDCSTVFESLISELQ